MENGTSSTGLREVVVATGGRVDAVAAEACEDLSRARVQRLLAAGAVTINGNVARKSDRVEAGDLLRIVIEETSHDTAAPTPDLSVLYEDDAVIAVDKPAGLVVHGGPGDTAPSVAGWFVKRYPTEATAFDVERPGIVHRLDKDTSGVLLLAKTPAAQAALSRAFEERAVVKEYLAVTDGVPAQPEAVIEAPIGRHPGDRTRMAIVRRGRESRTGYTVLAADGTQAVLLVRLYTGRTHQVRVHLAAVGAPVANDEVYGRAGDGRQLLHAWRLVVPYPGGGELEVASPAPADIARAIRRIGGEALAFDYTRGVPATLRPGAEVS